MARDLSCDSGLIAYRTKSQAEKANPGEEAKRCDRCRWFHVKKKGRRRAGGTRK